MTIPQDLITAIEAAALERAAKVCDAEGARAQATEGLTRETQNYFRMRDAIRALRPKNRDGWIFVQAVPMALMGGKLVKPRDPPMSLPSALSFADEPRKFDTMQCPADTEEELREALRVLACAYRAAIKPPASCPSNWQEVPEGYVVINEADFLSFVDDAAESIKVEKLNLEGGVEELKKDARSLLTAKEK